MSVVENVIDDDFHIKNGPFVHIINLHIHNFVNTLFDIANVVIV